MVSPVFNEAAGVEEFVDRVRRALDGLEWELVLVDDGSADATPAKMRVLAEADPRVRVVLLSRNFGQPVATSVGLEHAAGDAVVMIDSDLQDPPEVIPQLLERYSEGADVVMAVRSSRAGESRFKLVTARAFYRVFTRVTDVRLEVDAGDFRLLGRRALDALLAMPERGRFLRGMTTWIGFTQARVEYQRDARRTGSTAYRPRKLFRLAFDGIAAFTGVPLQAATVLGFAVSTLAFVLAVLLFVLRLTGDFIAGFSTTNILILLLGGIQLITIGVIGEYLSKVYEEVKRRPLYVVRERLNLPDAGDDPTWTAPRESLAAPKTQSRLRT